MEHKSFFFIFCMEPNFEQLREGHLHHAEGIGREIISEGIEELIEERKLENLPVILTAHFAADTADYSLNVRDELIEKAENHVQKYAAEMIGKEAREKARKGGLNGLDRATGEDEINLSEFGIAASISGWETWISDFYREFSRIDYLQKGLSEHKMEENDPRDIIKEVTETDRWVVNEENAGELYLEDIYVIDEDWIAFRKDERNQEGQELESAAYDKEVIEYLEELGVGDY